MSEQPEALRLADAINNPRPMFGPNLDDAAASELRRLHALCEEMGEALRYYREEFTGAEPSVSVLDRMADEALAKWKESK